MELKDAELAVVLLLEDAGLGSTTSTPPTLYAGPMPPGGPDELVSVQDMGGGEDPLERVGGGGVVALAPEVTVRVRGARLQYLAAKATATAAWQALWEAAPEGYTWVKPQGAGPTYLGPDEMGRERFSFTVRCAYRTSG